MNELAINTQGEGAVNTPPSEVASKPEAEITEDETDEVEHESKKYRVPKALKSAFLMHEDYTRRTQEVAERHRELEERRGKLERQADVTAEHVQDIAQLLSITEQLETYDNLDWTHLRQTNPEHVQDAWFEYMQLRNARDRLAGELQAKVNNRTLELQRHAAKRVDEARAILQRDIKDWSPELAGKLAEFGTRELGFTAQEISGVSDPRLIKLLHRAFIGDQAIKKAAAAQKLAAQEGLKPPAQVGGSASSNARKPTEASGDRLSADEWMRQRNEQLRKKGR